MEPIDKIAVCRMIHWGNLEFILKNGIYCESQLKADPDYTTIGHSKLINDRKDHAVPLENGGVLGDYIPFYFAGHSPMLYMITKGNQWVKQRSQKEIVFLITYVKEIHEENLGYVFTDMNAKLKAAQYYRNLSDLNRLRWDIIQDKFWKNSLELSNKQDYKQAEFLIRNHLPVNLIRYIYVFDESMKNKILNLVRANKLDIKVVVDITKNLYY